MGEQSPVSVAISVMLLGSIGFQMVLFYLVNWKDDDIKRYSWKVISQTISIFLAVMMFQAVNGLVESYILEGGSEMWEIGVDMAHMVFWLTALQIVVAISSGAVNEKFGGPELSEEVAEDVENAELNVKSYAVLFAHLAGFACINAWGSLQQHIFESSAFLSFLVVPIGLVGLFCMYSGYGIIRDREALSDDGKVDKFETIWMEETEEAEDDVAGLSLSFLAIQALRYQICGVLPDQEGMEGEVAEQLHSSFEWEVLCACGVTFFLVSLVVSAISSKFFGEEENPFEEHGEGGEHGHAIAEHGEEHGGGEHGGGEHGGGEHGGGEHELSPMHKRLERTMKILNNFFNFAFAWALFFGAKWAVCGLKFTSEHALLSVCLALLLSALAFLLIFVLDYLLDHKLLGEGDLAKDSGDALIDALAILIGFSWEQCFDKAVTVIAEGQGERLNPAITKLLMSVCLVLIVFPAWYWYILPQEVELEKLVSDPDKAMLKKAAEKHREFLLDANTNDHALDKAHLALKEHRRVAHGNGVDRSLKHLQVTTEGIKEVERRDGQKKKKGGHMKESDLTRGLLE